MTLKTKAIKGFAWTAFEGLFSQSIIFIIGIILARLLTPKDFGLIGIITVFVSIGSSIVEGGFSSALIQKKNADQKDFSTIFFANLLISLFLYFVLFISSEYIANFFNEDSLTKIIKYAGLIIIINSLIIIQRTILIINLNFRIISVTQITGTIIGAIIALFMAFKGFGIWSLVALAAVRPLISSLLLWQLTKWRPSFVFSLTSFKTLFDFGYKVLIAQLINSIYANIYYFLIGKFFSPTSLGYYTRANQFQAPFSVNLAMAVSRISFPILSSLQDDQKRIKEVFRKFLRFSVLINFTILITIAAVAKPLVLLTIGEKWSTSIKYLQILCVPGMLYPLQILNINLLTALGFSDLQLKIEIIKKIVLIPLVLISALFSIEIMLYSLVLFTFIEYFINSFYAKKLINYSIIDQIKDIFPYFVISLIMFVAMFIVSYFPLSLFFMISIQLIIGAMTFFILNEIFRLEEYIEIKSNVINNLKKIIAANIK